MKKPSSKSDKSSENKEFFDLGMIFLDDLFFIIMFQS